MRLIDADAFIDKLSHVPMVQEAIRKAMDTMPTVDAVEVVRCKDCVLSEFEDGWVSLWCNFWDKCTEEDGYCSYRRRKDD